MKPAQKVRLKYLLVEILVLITSILTIFQEEDLEAVEAEVVAAEAVTIAIKRDTLPVNALRLANNKFMTCFMLFIVLLANEIANS